MDPLPVVQSRACGPCTACCFTMGVTELAKPRNARCSRVIDGKGCGVYDGRPQSCQDFSCVWLMDDGRVLRNMERPDRVGLVLYATSPGSAFMKETGLQMIV